MSHSSPSSRYRESLACQLTSEELTQRKHTVIASLKKQVVESRETTHGYAYKFKSGDEIIDRLTEFIKTERCCCPFFTFTLFVAKQSEGVWLELAGPAGAKEFIKTELGF